MMMRVSIALLAAQSLFVSAQELPDISSSTTCEPLSLCYNLTMAGYAFETSQRALPNSPFYTVPSNFSEDLEPGTLLAVEVGTNLTNYTVPAGLTMSRLLYTSTDLNGKVLPASAYIVWPANLPSSQPRCRSSPTLPVVAWAHGTSGLFPACGPSNYRSLQYNFMMPYALALQGMAVIAPDYVGLGLGAFPNGESIPHAYGASPAQANDVANAIIAARKAFSILTDSPFVCAGHSQGGGVAWAFAERQAKQPVPGYRGTVAFAPATDVIGTIAAANDALAGGKFETWVSAALGFVQHSTIAGVTSLYPSFNFTGMTSIVRDRFFNVAAKVQACLPTDSLIFATVPPAELGEPGWTNTFVAQEFRKRTSVGGKEFAGPLLVIAGKADSAVQFETVEKVIEATCDVVNSGNTSSSLEFVSYEAKDHFPVIQASQHYWMDWIKEHLHGTGSSQSRTNNGTTGCTKRNVEAFRNEFSQSSISPNWLVTAAAPMAEWQYSF
ncbi:unnamed protein product [Clonostachys rosea]|uniref:AB hydrolase-1 domain-containing protein n=1 Tax=Bionectria ochroleuca TaxID=29856 RepID=A0ABY6U6W7_BIOOC|nr:unnamed protein product [Clonostachys rosea]